QTAGGRTQHGRSQARRTMSVTAARAEAPDTAVAPPSPAGPAEGYALSLPAPPLVPLPRLVTTLRASVRHDRFVFMGRRRFGEVFRIHDHFHDQPEAVTCHPDHVRSLFTADPEIAPSVTANSELVPVVGRNSVLTAIGPRHM